MPPLRTLALAFLSALAAAPGTVAGADAALYLVDTTFAGEHTTINRLDPASGEMLQAADLGSSLGPVLGLAAADNKVLYATGTDTSLNDTCHGLRSCLLLRVELAADPSSLPEVTVVGPVRTADGVVTEIIGLTFRGDGMLLATSQETRSLYEVDPGTGWANLMGEIDLVLHGGDVTMDDLGQVWLWTNLGDGSGLYRVDPGTGHASAFQLFPGISTTGLAAVGHAGILYAARPSGDQLMGIDPVTGFAVASLPLTLDGRPFDHARGDLDSPFCGDDAACDDGDEATADLCTPGGCRHRKIMDVDSLCPCAGPGRPWTDHGEYMKCVAAATRTEMDTALSPRRVRGRTGGSAGEQAGGRGRIVSAAARSSCPA